MMVTAKAELADGRFLEYIVAPDPPTGGMKHTYFAPDRSYVLHFYHDREPSKDPSRRARLDKLIGPYNPTLDPKCGSYWQNLFHWPAGIVVKPGLGVVYTTLPADFFFSDGPLTGKAKESSWFVLNRPRRMMTEKDRGTWINYFQICVRLARAVRRLHGSGLAHSDFSPRNILIDPSSGRCMMTGIEDLVIPGFFPTEVMGTPGYMAPEVLATMHLPINDPTRRHPCCQTDLYALAVMIYELLLLRHPLRGPKVHATSSTEDDERLAMGEKALFIEDPADASNRPSDLRIPYTVLGPFLSDLVHRAFVDGLHRPDKRPHATLWERALRRTWDLKVDCQNPGCPSKWFVFQPANPCCPFCGSRRQGTVPILKLRKQRREGQWSPDCELVIHNNQSLFCWHALDNRFPSEAEADKKAPVAYCVFHQGRWLLINQALPTLTCPSGARVPVGQALALTHGAVFRFSDDPHGRQAEVHIVNC